MYGSISGDEVRGLTPTDNSVLTLAMTTRTVIHIEPDVSYQLRPGHVTSGFDLQMERTRT